MCCILSSTFLSVMLAATFHFNYVLACPSHDMVSPLESKHYIHHFIPTTWHNFWKITGSQYFLNFSEFSLSSLSLMIFVDYWWDTIFNELHFHHLYNEGFDLNMTSMVPSMILWNDHAEVKNISCLPPPSLPPPQEVARRNKRMIPYIHTD